MHSVIAPRVIITCVSTTRTVDGQYLNPSLDSLDWDTTAIPQFQEIWDPVMSLDHLLSKIFIYCFAHLTSSPRLSDYPRTLHIIPRCFAIDLIVQAYKLCPGVGNQSPLNHLFFLSDSVTFDMRLINHEKSGANLVCWFLQLSARPIYKNDKQVNACWVEDCFKTYKI